MIVQFVHGVRGARKFSSVRKREILRWRVQQKNDYWEIWLNKAESHQLGAHDQPGHPCKRHWSLIIFLIQKPAACTVYNKIIQCTCSQHFTLVCMVIFYYISYNYDKYLILSNWFMCTLPYFVHVLCTNSFIIIHTIAIHNPYGAVIRYARSSEFWLYFYPLIKHPLSTSNLFTTYQLPPSLPVHRPHLITQCDSSTYLITETLCHLITQCDSSTCLITEPKP